MVLLLFLFGCSDSETSSPPSVEEPSFAEKEPVSILSAGNACFDAGFFPCPVGDCEGETTSLPAGTNNVCCKKPCVGSQEIVATEGDASATCAAQKGNDCKEVKTCPNQQWLRSSDVGRCCKVGCVERVQTELTIGGLGNVVIERITQGKFGVFYGPGAKMGSIDLGKTAYASAKSISGSEYAFKTSDGRSFTFTITKESDSEVTAEGVKSVAEVKKGCILYFEHKAVPDRPPVVILPVPQQCFGKPCVLRMKLTLQGSQPKQVIYTQIDNQYTISSTDTPGNEDTRFTPTIPIPLSGINGDSQQNYILFGPSGCIVMDDYPSLEQTKEKFVFMPPRLDLSISCQLEVCSS